MADLPLPIAQNPLWLKQDFVLRSQQISQQLQQDNIKKVALWIEDAVHFACVLFGCLNAKVEVLLPPNLLPDNLEWVETEGAFFFQQAEFEHYGLLQQVTELKPFIDRENRTPLWLRTSGSSGVAKIIPKTPYQLWAEMASLAQMLPPEMLERGANVQVLGSVSVQHMFGLAYRIFLALEMGWMIGREQHQYAEYLIAQSHQQKTVWITSPTLLSHINFEHPELKNHQIMAIFTAGGILHESVGNVVRENLGCHLIDIYGSTETCTIALRLDHGAWLPINRMEVGLNEQGALWAQCPWFEREQTADAADLVEGKFNLLGRIDRIIKLGDKRISLASIEQALLKHSWVTDCYVAMHPEHQRPLAWVALGQEGLAKLENAGRPELIRQLKGFIAPSLEKLALPRYWRFAEKLPRNPQSKISRADFEKICAEQE